jgi:hypothetical protein
MLCFVPLLAACGHPWRTAVQAAPNPFLGQGRFGVIPVTFTQTSVGETTEANWMAEKDGEQRASWVEDKVAINEKFTTALVEGAAADTVQVLRATSGADAPFLIRANVTFYEPGIYSFIYNKNTIIKMTVQITDPSGKVLDEVFIERQSAATLTNPSSGGRARDAAAQLGKLMASYVLFRVRGED